MSKVKDGDTVKVHYTGKLDNGTVFDSSAEREPLQFTMGKGQLIAGFEGGVMGMTVGEAKTITIPADEAYGPKKEELVINMGKDKMPDHISPEVGLQLQFKQPNGMTIDMVITEVNDDDIILDANHPLAGQDLTFEIEVVEIS